MNSFVFQSSRYDQHQDRMKDRNSLDNNGVSSILRQANNRFRRDDRQMDEDEELWFNDDDCEEENGEAGVSEALGGPALGEPDKADPVIGSCADKQADKMDVVAETVGPVVPTIDKVMEEDKKKELLKAVDIDSSSADGQPALNGAKKSMALVDYNDSDSDGEGKISFIWTTLCFETFGSILPPIWILISLTSKSKKYNVPWQRRRQTPGIIAVVGLVLVVLLWVVAPRPSSCSGVNNKALKVETECECLIVLKQ